MPGITISWRQEAGSHEAGQSDDPKTLSHHSVVLVLFFLVVLEIRKDYMESDTDTGTSGNPLEFTLRESWMKPETARDWDLNSKKASVRAR